MPVKGCGVKLGQDENPIYAGINAVTDGYIHQSELTSNGNGRFGSILCKWIQPFTFAAT